MDRSKKTKRRIKGAAIELFLATSPRAVTMADIAKASGLTRQTVYRLFNSRFELIEEILTDEVTEIRQRVVDFYIGRSLEEAVVEGVWRGVREAECSPIVMAFFNEGQERDLETFWTNHATKQWHYMLTLWSPVIAQARRQGRIRPGVSDENFVDWIIDITQMLLTKTEDDSERRDVFLRKFLVPSVLTDQTFEADEQVEIM